MLWVCCYKWRRQHDTCIILESGTTWVQFDSFTVCGPVLMNEEVAFCELYCQSECHHKANIVFMVSTLSYCFTFFLYLLKWMPHQKCLQTDPKCACLKVNPVISVRMIVPSGRLFSLPPNVVSWTAIAMFAFKYRLEKNRPWPTDPNARCTSGRKAISLGSQMRYTRSCLRKSWYQSSGTTEPCQWLSRTGVPQHTAQWPKATWQGIQFGPLKSVNIDHIHPSSKIFALLLSFLWGRCPHKCWRPDYTVARRSQW